MGFIARGLFNGAKGISEAHFGGAGTQGLLLGRRGGPAVQERDLETGGDLAIDVGLARVKLQHPRQCRPAQGSLMPLAHHVAFSHGAQVREQPQGIAIAHRDHITVGDWQGETGPLQQAAQVAQIGHRRDAGAEAAGCLDFGGGQMGAQLGQGVARKHRGQQQAIGTQGAAHLDQGAGQVIRPVQGQRRDDQVEAGLGKRQVFLIGDDRGGKGRGAARQCGHGRGGLDLQQPLDPKLAVQRLRHRAIARADNGGIRERAHYIAEPVGKALGHFGEQEIGFTNRARRAVSAQSPERPVKGAEALARIFSRNFHADEDRVFERKWEGCLGQVGGQVLRGVADALFPPVCMVCAAAVADARSLCATCWAEAHLIGGTVCDGCGTPMPLALGRGESIRCDPCLGGGFPWDRGRAAAHYGGSARALILTLKHGDRPDIARALGRWMTRAAADLIPDSDVVVPIPLHWRRFLTRRYNQSAELSRVMAQEAGLLHSPDMLRRMRPTEMQRSHAAARARNVEGAFAVPPHMRAAVRGQRILVVDDVLTTGATLSAATLALREAGARQINVAVFARVEAAPRQ